MASEHIEALDMVANGDWDGAHQLIQEIHDELACRIHGYLHIVEGDFGNAAYWYNKVGEDVPESDPDQELQRLLGMALPD